MTVFVSASVSGALQQAIGVTVYDADLPLAHCFQQAQLMTANANTQDTLARISDVQGMGSVPLLGGGGPAIQRTSPLISDSLLPKQRRVLTVLQESMWLQFSCLFCQKK
jgi:hypothetical protein